MTTATPAGQRTSRPVEGATSGSRKADAYERNYTGRGPTGPLLAGTMREYGADPTGSMRAWRDLYGDFVPLRFGPFRAHVAFGPAEIEEVLTERAADSSARACSRPRATSGYATVG